ncbi:PRD domain-containing protein [Virgibacillus sp. NKC19-3]|uniref:PRD domain-containing protein n=1 Tax=Virgibacillus saliphilus TaxID=2831674 RepID=UPI001C9B8384|nr:PRD domain-containing protein [Virgibacillus sp. NKC19-3]MBY7142782.1 PRD domain-containing protein [Virgibacillus sp. NKC19-3]
MKLKKVLSNNAVIATDELQNEQIAIGRGIGFGKKKNHIIPNYAIEKLFVLKENEQLQQLILRIPEQHFELSNDIISYAEQQLDTKLNEHVLIALTDHISFAIERKKKGIHLRNKLTSEIKALYKREFKIGIWAVQYIKEKTKEDLSIDEAAFIALYIHTMNIEKGNFFQEAVKQTTIVKDMIDSIKSHLKIKIREEELAYERLVVHLHFALTRTSNQHESYAMDDEMLQMVKRKFKHSFRIASKSAKKINNLHGINLPEHELGYVAIHLERLKNVSQEQTYVN